MDMFSFNSVDLIGLFFVLVFFGLILGFSTIGRKKSLWELRKIPAFSKLRQSINSSVETGRRLHVSLGRGNISGIESASALVGLSILSRITKTAGFSDRHPVSTSGNGSLMILSQDTVQSSLREGGEVGKYEVTYARMSGTSPFSYAAGTLPLIYDEQVSASVLTGHYGSEVALITDANERSESMTLAGSDQINAQAVLYAAANEPLIGEELYAAGAYMGANPSHKASIKAQDFIRWMLVVVILVGSGLKLAGVL